MWWLIVVTLLVVLDVVVVPSCGHFGYCSVSERGGHNGCMLEVYSDGVVGVVAILTVAGIVNVLGHCVAL